MRKKLTASRVIGLGMSILIILITTMILKLAYNVDWSWSWLWITAPLCAGVILILAVLFVIAIIVSLFKQHK